MEQVNVFIDKKRLTQFQGINSMVVTNSAGKLVKANIFDTYDIRIVNGDLETNIDVFLVGHHDVYHKLANFEHLLGDRLVYVRQHFKSANIASYNKLLKDKMSYIPMRIYSISDVDDVSQYCFDEYIYYVKPEYGARSLNQFIVDNRMISMATFLGKLLTNHYDNRDAEAERITEIVNSTSGHVKHIKGCERYENEHADTNFTYCAHQMFTDIVLECRVIQSNYGSDIRFFKRERNNSNDGIVDNEIFYTSEITPQDIGLTGLTLQEFDIIRNDLSYAFEKLKFFQGCLDIVFNKNGEYTIVETSNQFGAADIDPSTKYLILKSAITALVDKVSEE